MARNIWQEIDNTYQLEEGKRMFYQLTDEEGGTQDKSRKVPAIISAITTGERDGRSGQAVVDLFVMRPPSLGGSFDTENIRVDSDRNPGTCDIARPEDTSN